MNEADHQRLVQLIGVAGSSAMDGEALNALRFAVRLASKNKLTLLEALRLAGKAELDTIRLAQLERDAFERGIREGLAQAKQAAQAEAQAAAQKTAVVNPWAARLNGWPDFAADCLHSGRLNPWEVSFCESFIERGWSAPTDKQLQVFLRIASKTGLAPPSLGN